MHADDAQNQLTNLTINKSFARRVLKSLVLCKIPLNL